MQAETAVGDSFTTQVIGGILNKTVAASEGPGHELCSPCVVTSNVLRQSLASDDRIITTEPEIGEIHK